MVRRGLSGKVLGPSHSDQSGNACQPGSLSGGMNGHDDQFHGPPLLSWLLTRSLVTHIFPREALSANAPPGEPGSGEGRESTPGFTCGPLIWRNRKEAAQESTLREEAVAAFLSWPPMLSTPEGKGGDWQALGWAGLLESPQAWGPGAAQQTESTGF